MKRRQLLKLCSGSLVVSGLGLGRVSTALAELGFEKKAVNFAAIINQKLWLNHPDYRAVGLTLERVLTPESKIPNPHLEQFSLILRGPARQQINAGSYEVDHPRLGRFMLYLAPTGNDGKGISYRADFSLLL